MWHNFTSWLDSAVQAITRIAPERTFFAEGFNVYALLAVLLVSLCCGAVGSLVIGSRMAFFSDALAHCAFAGVSIGYCIFELGLHRPEREFWEWVTPIMAVFGICVGVGIAYVRTNTALASDTVIGVFFAGAIGLAAMLQNLMQSRALFNMEDFLFGNPLNVQKDEVAVLILLTLFT